MQEQNSRQGEKGKLYGIGVGPGDPELMTLKAVRIIKECDVIAVPGVIKEDSVAYQIAAGAVEGLEKKECLAIHMPMTKDAAQLAGNHAAGAKLLEDCLDSGKNIAFLTLGDPTIYSTYMYLHKAVSRAGYAAELVSGIPSFCAAAARCNISLGEKDQQIHIIPSSYEVEEAAQLPGTRIFMKAGSKMGYLKETLRKKGGEIYMAERCTMEGEQLCQGIDNMKEDASYYSVVIVK